MAQRAFLSRALRERAADAVRDVEGHTSVELVVAVRRRSATYREADYLVGFVAATASLVLMLLLPEEFHWLSALIDLPIVFAAASAISAQFGLPRRLLARRARRAAEVHRAARAAFHELGISRTRGRTGLLVFVSVLERKVELVADFGIDPALLGADFAAVTARLQATVKALDDAAFVAALRDLGPVLGRALPRQADDVNELPDEVSAA